MYSSAVYVAIYIYENAWIFTIPRRSGVTLLKVGTYDRHIVLRIEGAQVCFVGASPRLSLLILLRNVSLLGLPALSLGRS